jgi:hypothetical protein
MTVYRSETQSIADNNENPSFNKNMVDFYQVSRLDNGINAKTQTLFVAQLLQFKKEFTYSEDVQRLTLQHKLGYRPIVLGKYYLDNHKNTRIIGDMPNVYEEANTTFIIPGHLWVDDVTNGSVTIAWKMSDFGLGTDTLIGKLYLLENGAI